MDKQKIINILESIEFKQHPTSPHAECPKCFGWDKHEENCELKKMIDELRGN